ncbi:MAG: helix-turn-helix domain-containing protein [Treponema sp.]|nr:helix-turn-helix domain-containing protein [Treponema sp.]
MQNFERLRILRETIGVTQGDFAKTIGVAPSFISGIERNKKDVSRDMLERLIDKYKVNINWLLTGEGEMFLGRESQEDESEKHPLVSNIESIIENRLQERMARVEEEIASIQVALEELLKHLPANILESAMEYPTQNMPEPGYEYPATTAGEDFVAGEEPVYAVAYWDRVAAGPPIRQSPDGWERVVYVEARLIKTKPEDYLVMRVSGSSMKDALIPDASVILLRWSDVPAHGRIQAVWVDDGTTIKRVLEDEEHGWTLHYEDGTDRVVPLGEENHIVGDFVAVLPPYTQSYLRREE